MASAGFEAMLAAARGGQAWALADLYRSVYPRLLGYTRAFEPNEAEDIAGDAWLDLIGALERFHGNQSGLRALAFTIARRRLQDLRRRRARQRTDPSPAHELVPRGEIGNVEADAFASLGTDWAVSLIRSSLSEEQADVILLRVLGDLDVPTVARLVGKRPGTVRVIQHRALRRLARVLQGEGVTR